MWWSHHHGEAGTLRRVGELRLRDDVDSILHLELTAATEAMARDLADRFRQDPEGVYTRLLSALYPPAEQ